MESCSLISAILRTVRRKTHPKQVASARQCRAVSRRRLDKVDHLEPRLCLSVCGLVPIGAVNSGIASVDNATGLGYIMYSEESVFARFSGVHPSNSVHLISVRHDGQQWLAGTNETWTSFTPAESDHLIAAVNYSADTISSLQGTFGQYQSIGYGFDQADLTFVANIYSGKVNKGEFTVGGTYFEVPCAEIQLTGNSEVILDGDLVPSVTDDTDWGSVSVSSLPITRSFTITNVGDDDLFLTGTPLVQLSGSSVFQVTQQPAVSVVSGLQSVTFDVTLDPTLVGVQSATLQIANSDSDEPLYTFAIVANVSAVNAPSVF